MIITPPRLLLDVFEAWFGLRSRAFRSLLSGLGIGVGVVALVAMLSVSEGAKEEALSRIESLGTRTIRVENAFDQAQRAGNTANLSQGLTVEDLTHLRGWLGERGNASGFARQNQAVLAANRATFVGDVFGVSPGWIAAERLQVTRGRPLLRSDFDARRVCLAGNRIAASLKLSPGDWLTANDVPCQVVGILAPRGRLLTEGTGLSSINFDKSIIMPLSAFPFSQRVGTRQLLDGMVLNIAPDYTVLRIARQVEELVQRRHREVQDFRIVSPVRLLDEARETQQLFALITGSIAGLSLLVGGIGVMNVMLANIVEQTREIGLRMAVGASKARIIALFLWESVLLTALGGVWGIAAGVAAALAIESYADWEVAFSAANLIIAPLFAVITGVLFGVYPAIRAAALDPALAVREA